MDFHLNTKRLLVLGALGFAGSYALHVWMDFPSREGLSREALADAHRPGSETEAEGAVQPDKAPSVADDEEGIAGTEATTSVPAARPPSSGQAAADARDKKTRFPDETVDVRAVPASGILEGVNPAFIQPAAYLDKAPPSEEAVAARLAKARNRAAARQAEAWEWARANGKPVEGEGFELMYLDESGRPVYYETDNRNARISHNVFPLNQLDTQGGSVNLSGFGWKVGMWEQDAPRVTHEEFQDGSGDPRVFYRELGGNADVINNNIENEHATHVLGTMIGNGNVNQDARGMAWLATADAYDWFSDMAELEAAGATVVGQPDKLYVSNHSYGAVSGWKDPRDSLPSVWVWQGFGGDPEDYRFGRYDRKSVQFDAAVRRSPYVLPFKSAGNDRGEIPPPGAEIEFEDASFQTVTGIMGAVPDTPSADGAADGGYDTIPTYGIAKNVMTVGNMHDAVLGDQRFPLVGMVASSGFGPADDGRIKPDVVANGHGVLSAGETADDALKTLTGTSMASPGAAGTGILLQEHYADRLPGTNMRASTLKALMIHTATDVFAAGPDYQSGWGLIDAVAAVEQIDRHPNPVASRHIVENVVSDSITSYRLAFQADVGEPVRATLVWTDPEGDNKIGLDDRTSDLVNDLDLTIRLPDGTLKQAPQLDPDDPTAAAAYNGNSLDNVEMVGGPGDPIIGDFGIYELIVSYKGTLTELIDQYDPVTDTTTPVNGPNPRQVFSLIFQGHDPVDTGTIAEAVDQDNANPALNRVFTVPDDADTTFAYVVVPSSVDGDRADSLNIDDNETAAFESRVSGPVTVLFDWSVSSEPNFDFFQFLVNGTVVEEISGSVGMTTVSHVLPPGDHVLRWQYTKDFSVSEGADFGAIDNLRFNGINEGLDNNDYVFVETARSVANWDIQVTDGGGTVPTGDVARSGDTDPFGVSEIETTIEGPAVVRLRMVQTGDGLLDLNFGNTGGFIRHREGNAWRRYTFQLPEGPQPVRFAYTRLASGSGSGRVDEFEVYPMPVDLDEAANSVPGPGIGRLAIPEEAAPWLSDATDGAPLSGARKDAVSVRSLYTADGDQAGRANLLDLLLVGPGVLSFWWQATGDPSGEFSLLRTSRFSTDFQFAYPGEGPRNFGPIRGGDGWQQVYVEVPAGSHTFRWRYIPGPTEGSAWLDRVNFIQDKFHPARGVDRWSAPWNTLGEGTWFGQFDASTRNRIDSTTHEPISNRQSTSLTTEIQGPKRLSFRWKVSSEQGFDYFRFYLNGEESAAISGQQDWAEVVRELPAGLNILRWAYEKDGSVDNGQDRGWLDEVVILRPDYGITGIRTSGNAAVLNVRKDATAGFFLERSTDLTDWQPAFSANNGMLTPSATNGSFIVPFIQPASYYRIVFRPEISVPVENSSFEEPVVSPNFFVGNFPGWGPLDDGFTTTSVEHIPGFASGGTQHLSIAQDAFLESTAPLEMFHGVHTLLVNIGNRENFTGDFNLTDILFIEDSGTVMGGMRVEGQNSPLNGWLTSPPLSIDAFSGSPDTPKSFRIRFESRFSRGFFDSVQVITEPQ